MYPHLLASRHPRAPLGVSPTPLAPMDGLRNALGGPGRCPRLWVKHEDLIALGGGGNKIRKLEFVLGKALADGHDTVINTGGIQSNQTRQTAAAAARLGLECHLLLRRSETPITEIYEQTGNILACRLFGAHIHFVEAHENRTEAMQELALRLLRQGKKPCVIPVGASTSEGVIGSMLCGEEIMDQAMQQGFVPDWLVVTVGSSGTCAGIFAAVQAVCLERGGTDRVRVLGVDVLGNATDQEPVEKRLRAHSDQAATMLGFSFPHKAFRRNNGLRHLQPIWDGSHLELTMEYAGPGYARPYPAMIKALSLAARTEGLILDPIYTGKTMAALIAGVEKGLFDPGANVVFLHSGGQPSLFAYAHQLDEALSEPDNG